MRTEDFGREEVISLDDASSKVSLTRFIEQMMQADGISEASAWRKLVLAGASRVAQLHRYNQKKKEPEAKFRAYKPLKLSAEARGDIARVAKDQGIVPEVDTRPMQCPARDARGVRCTRKRGHVPADAHKF